jgi:2-polyprenyl-3-methyl-5-hydroxy-6-metoxy-1,4-benzoquinol methylase
MSDHWVHRYSKSRLLKLLLRTILPPSPISIEEQLGFPKTRKNELEEVLRVRLLESDWHNTQIYEKTYDEWHKFQLQYTQTSRDQIYPSNPRRYDGICKLVGKGKEVLEIGCGEGTLSMAVANALNKVTGTDVSRTILELAEQHRRTMGCEHVTFKHSRSDHLEFPSNAFDCVISKDVLEHLHPRDVPTHLSEARRVLRDGGFYLLMTPNRYAGEGSHGLHLRTYTYRELKTMLLSLGKFVLKSPLLPIIFSRNIVVPLDCKVVLEQRLHALGAGPLTFALTGLDPLAIIAYKNGN